MCGPIMSQPQKPTEVKVLMSFGARNGGFEFAWELRNRIQNEKKKTVYLDALSLEGVYGTTYAWDTNLGIYKMGNPDWAKFYSDAMDSCDYMIFLISDPWLKSYYCWYEYELFLKKEQGPPRVKIPIFIIFSDTDKSLLHSNHITVCNPTNSNKSIKSTKDLCLYIDKCRTFHITQNSSGPGRVTVQGAPYSYNYNYTCSDSEASSILRVIQ